MIRIFLSLAIITFCGVFTTEIAARGCPVEYGYQGNYNFQQETKSFVSILKFNEISQSVKHRIEEQLKLRVGEEFFTKLKFDYGRAEDFDDSSPLKADASERIDGYDFVFKFSDKKKGLKIYHFKVVTDGTGNIIADLALPVISTNSSKGNLVPCEQALTIAERNGFPRENSSIYFEYDWDSGSFVWVIYNNQAVKPDDSETIFTGLGTFMKMLIEANTGIVLKISKETILV